MANVFGVDVSKAWFDIGDGKSVFKLDNERSAIVKWLKTLPHDAVIAMEATSNYHALLAKLAHQFGLTVFVLNPRHVHHYEKGVGRRAKTDKVDASLIRRYVVQERSYLNTWQPPTPQQKEIDTLTQRRYLLMTKKQSIVMAFKDIADTCEGYKEMLKQITAVINHLEKRIVQTIKQEPNTLRDYQLITSIPGIGPLTAAFMCNVLNKHSFSSIDQLTSFLGMDLIHADSGKKYSKRSLSKHGSSESRRLLFNCARAASQGQLKVMYEKFAARMIHTKATVAMMRKLLKLVFGVWKSKTAFDINKYQSPLLQNA